MGACASKFKVLKSADGADLPEEDVKSSRELLIKKDAETPAAADDEHSKRQMLGNLLKEDAGEPVARVSDGNESWKVKQYEQKVQSQEIENVKSAESLVADAPAKDAGLVLESRALEEVKKSHDGEPANKNVETVVSQKATEDNSVEDAKIEASGEVDNQGTEKPGEIEKPLEKSSLSKEMEAQCLDKSVEEKIAVEKGTQEKHDTDTTKEVGVPEVDKPVLEEEIEKKPEVVMEVSVPEVEMKEEPKLVLERATEKEPEVVMEVSVPAETEKNNEKKPASTKEDMEKEEQHAEKKVQVPANGKNDELKLPSSAAAEKELENKQGETTPTLEIPGTEKLDSEVEMDIRKESDEATGLELAEKKHDEQELKETEVMGVEKPASTSNAGEEKSEDQLAAVGNTTKIEASPELKAEDIQLVADGTPKIKPDEKAQADKDKQAEHANKEQPIGMNNKSEEDR